jgi:hypothetical protein
MALPPDGPQVRQPPFPGNYKVNKQTPDSSWIGRLCFLADGCVFRSLHRPAEVFSALHGNIAKACFLSKFFQ